MSDEAPSNSGRLSDGTFAPGNRHSRGRQLGSRNKATAILDEIADGEAESVLRAVLDAAKAGDTTAAQAVLARVWPMRKGRAVRIELPPITTAADVSAALGTLVGAVANGELTPEEAGPVAALLEGKRRAIETAELEARIRRLEEGR